MTRDLILATMPMVAVCHVVFLIALVQHLRDRDRALPAVVPAPAVAIRLTGMDVLCARHGAASRCTCP